MQWGITRRRKARGKHSFTVIERNGKDCAARKLHARELALSGRNVAKIDIASWRRHHRITGVVQISCTSSPFSTGWV